MSCAAIRADFATYRPVPSRRVLQLILEVPIEQQGDVFAKLGYPVPDTSTWCAIALLQDPPPPGGESPAGAANPGTTTNPRAPAGAYHQKDPDRSLAGKQRYDAADDKERAVIDAAMLANDPAFWKWTKVCYTQEMAADYIREHCGVKSRAEFAINPAARDRFRQLQTDFMVAIGRVPEIR